MKRCKGVIVLLVGLALWGCAPSDSGGWSFSKPAENPDVIALIAGAPGGLFFPQIAVGGGYTTVLTLLHVDGRASAGAATGILRFFNADGSDRSVTTAEMGTATQFNITIPRQGVRELTITSTGPVTVGSARFDVSGVAVNGVATFTAGDGVVGVANAEPVRIGYIPLNTRTGFANGVAIQNPLTTPVNLTLRLRRDNGDIDQTSSPPELNPLPPNGQFSRFIGPEMGFNSPIRPNSTLEIEASGTGFFAALPLVIGNGLISSSVLISTENDIPLAFSQVVDGGGYQTVMRFFNPSDLVYNGIIRFYNADGTQRSLDLLNRGRFTELVFQINPKGTLVLETTGTASAVGVGAARIESLQPIGAAATIFFGPTHVGVPASTRMRAARIAVNTRTGFNTGVAVNSIRNSPINLRFTLQNSEGAAGQVVQPSGVSPLLQNRQYARYVTEMGFPAATNIGQSSLLIEIVGGGTFTPMALFDRNNIYSTTAVARQILFDPPGFAGTYAGTWSGGPPGPPTQFGDITMTITRNAATNTGQITFGITGIPEYSLPETHQGTFDSNGFTASINSTILGTGTMVIKPDGTLSLRASGDSFRGLLAFSLDGEFDGARIAGTIEGDGGVNSPARFFVGTFTVRKLN